ncbi:ATP-binding protein [Roseivivax sp. CAU 1753]
MVLTLCRQVEGRLSGVAQSRFGICLSEALTNLVLHAPTPHKEAVIDISLSIEKEIVVELFDPKGAPAFDPREQASALLQVDPMAESGRGLGLIMECADRVEYGAVAKRNRLILGFRLQG